MFGVKVVNSVKNFVLSVAVVQWKCCLVSKDLP